METKFITRQNEKLLKTKLYFLANPRDLIYSDIYRHVCRVCKRVFHIPSTLEWHMMDYHHSHLEQFRTDLARSTSSLIRREKPYRKRSLPFRSAAPRGPKRWKLSSECDFNGNIKQETDSYSDIDKLLESSSSSEDEVEPKNMNEKMVMRELRVTVNKLKCSSDRITDHDSGSSACNDIKEDVVPFSSAYSDIQIVYNSGDKTGRSSIEPEVVNLSSASSRSISSQASHWTAPEIKETNMELDRLPKLGQAKYKVTWWVATAEPIGQSLRDSDIFWDLDTKRLKDSISMGPKFMM